MPETDDACDRSWVGGTRHFWSVPHDGEQVCLFCDRRRVAVEPRFPPVALYERENDDGA